MVVKLFWKASALFTVFSTVVLLVLIVHLTFKSSEDKETLLVLEKWKPSSSMLNSTVHLAVVVENATAAVALVKSILIHCHKSIHFHFLVANEVHRHVLVTLINSWELPKLGFSLYSISSHIKNDSWIPNANYFDSVNDIIKLHLPSVLPVTLDQVIVLADTYLLATGDIHELWNYFSSPEIKEKPLGISATHSHSKLQYDGSIVFYNLDLLRSIQWRRVWHRGAQKSKTTPFQITSAAIINNIITEFPNIYSFLPCMWVENCRIIAYCNRTTKSFFVRLQYGENSMCAKALNSSYHSVEHRVQNYNSVSLKSNFYDKKKRFNKVKRLTRVRICRTLKEDASLNYVTTLFYTGSFYHPSDAYETSLVTQLSTDRVQMFQMLLNHWDGPVSIAIYGNDSQIWTFMQYINQQQLSKRQNLAIHFVIKQGTFYPVNYLRNVALSNARTEFVFLDDGDFLPSYGLFARLKSYNEQLLGSSKRALVIPAFQTIFENITYPTNKRELLTFIRSSKVTTFCPTCKHQTHAATRYEEWYKSQYPYEVDWTFHYEPYVVVRKNVVHYDRRFMGYGWNKVSQITELKAQGYQFIVVPDHFIVHMPHSNTKDKHIWTMGVFKYCIDRIWKSFLIDLKKKYGRNCLAEKHSAGIVFKYIDT